MDVWAARLTCARGSGIPVTVGLVYPYTRSLLTQPCVLHGRGGGKADVCACRVIEAYQKKKSLKRELHVSQDTIDTDHVSVCVCVSVCLCVCL
jgi:hypothetical protein